MALELYGKFFLIYTNLLHTQMAKKLSGTKILRCLFDQRKISHILYQKILIGIV